MQLARIIVSQSSQSIFMNLPLTILALLFYCELELSNCTLCFHGVLDLQRIIFVSKNPTISTQACNSSLVVNMFFFIVLFSKEIIFGFCCSQFGSNYRKRLVLFGSSYSSCFQPLRTFEAVIYHSLPSVIFNFCTITLPLFEQIHP